MASALRLVRRETEDQRSDRAPKAGGIELAIVWLGILLFTLSVYALVGWGLWTVSQWVIG